MADREQPYDPYIPSGGAGQQGAQGQNGNMRTAALQAVRCHRMLSRVVE
jgi:vesicle-associated membrane protein 4